MFDRFYRADEARGQARLRPRAGDRPPGRRGPRRQRRRRRPPRAAARCCACACRLLSESLASAERALIRPGRSIRGMPIRVLLAALAATALARRLRQRPRTPTSVATRSTQNRAGAARLRASACASTASTCRTRSSSGGRVTMRAGGPGTAPSAKMDAAQKACEHYQKQIKAPPISHERAGRVPQGGAGQREVHARPGIDFPDPTFGANGGARVQIGKGRASTPTARSSRPRRRRARSTLPEGGRTVRAALARAARRARRLRRRARRPQRPSRRSVHHGDRRAARPRRPRERRRHARLRRHGTLVGRRRRHADPRCPTPAA